ncbi:hypothetical protein [Tropicibacter naphthalenivorans]|uniref:hypothetical protein n=1 Tax=Tropicibacter naphthalenivorans TaxID=441103 RepID=UPI00117C45B8|nr:hypothetical protein [Tropicibacter naphthalenivorans]
MNWEVVTGISSVIAILISILAWWTSYRAAKDQSKLTLRETELVRLLIAKEQRDHASSLSTEVSARLHNTGKHNWKLRVFNRGPAEAKNVRLEVLSENSFFSESWISNKFPMPRMEAGQSVDILASVVLSSHEKEDIRILWDDSTGKNRSNTITVTI